MISNGYHTWWGNVFCPDYGLPQNRKRLVLLASRFGPISFIDPTHDKENYVSVEQAISHLPPLNAGSSDKNDNLHRASKLSDINLERIRHSHPGGSWKSWPKKLLPDCYKRETGQTYSSVYGRMKWSDPSPTITTQFYGYGTGRFGHPTQDRALSLREGAILLSFPVDYEFFDKAKPLYIKRIAKLIGNAVPVKLGEAIGLSIKKHLQSY